MIENKNKMPTFRVENKRFSQNFVFALKKLVFCCLDPDLDPEKTNPDPKHWFPELITSHGKEQFHTRSTAQVQLQRSGQ